ncbi:MAG: acyl transferase [Flavobacteriales bacterium]|nr:acyl transferase [Flavobacteriales bacterium]
MNFANRIFNITSSSEFNNMAIDIFNYQYQNNTIYQNFCKLLKVTPSEVTQLEKIPFLPIEFFKTQQVICGDNNYEQVFLSSGTTGENQSKHYVKNLKVYEQSFVKGFELFYGNISDYCFLALLPSYMEREGSSLIYMTEYLIKHSNNPLSGFYLNNYNDLIDTLKKLNAQKTILIGVSFALLDLAEKHQLDLSNIIIMETGGMKGRRKEMTRTELHQIYNDSFNVNQIHSEYGMTELLSQAYSKGNGLFETPPWMKILIRDTNDPFHLLDNNQTGGINVIDLANYNSCSFIATQDLGKTFTNNSFEVLGRFDNSDLRGCNLLIQ